MLSWPANKVVPREILAHGLQTHHRDSLFFWWLLAFLTDVNGGLKELGVVTTVWLAGTNYPFLVQTLNPFGVSDWLPPLLFVGIITWSFLSTILFAIAAITPMHPASRWRARVNSAFIVSLGLWLAFFLADQIVMKFDLEQNHMVQGGFQLLCFFAIHLLPGDREGQT